MLSIISSVIDGVSTYFSKRQELSNAKLKREIAIEENKARLAKDSQSYNHEWEMASLQNKDRWIQRLSFLMFAAPFIVAIFFPHHIKIYFEESIRQVPEWWTKTFMAINGAVWGLGQLKRSIPQLIEVFKKK